MAEHHGFLKLTTEAWRNTMAGLGNASSGQHQLKPVPFSDASYPNHGHTIFGGKPGLHTGSSALLFPLLRLSLDVLPTL